MINFQKGIMYTLKKITSSEWSVLERWTRICIKLYKSVLRQWRTPPKQRWDDFLRAAGGRKETKEQWERPSSFDWKRSAVNASCDLSCVFALRLSEREKSLWSLFNLLLGERESRERECVFLLLFSSCIDFIYTMSDFCIWLITTSKQQTESKQYFILSRFSKPAALLYFWQLPLFFEWTYWAVSDLYIKCVFLFVNLPRILLLNNCQIYQEISFYWILSPGWFCIYRLLDFVCSPWGLWNWKKAATFDACEFMLPGLRVAEKKLFVFEGARA